MLRPPAPARASAAHRTLRRAPRAVFPAQSGPQRPSRALIEHAMTPRTAPTHAAACLPEEECLWSVTLRLPGRPMAGVVAGLGGAARASGACQGSRAHRRRGVTVRRAPHAEAEERAPGVAAWRRLLQLRRAAAAAALGASAVVLGAAHGAHAISENNLLFLEAWRAVDRAYVDKTFNGVSWFRYRETAVKNEKMGTTAQTYDAIRKMLTQLDDPFTRFLEPAQLDYVRQADTGATVGVGLELTYDGGLAGGPLVVVAPATGSPADRAGMRPGDLVEAIDGVPTAGASLYDVAERLQGPEGSFVELAVRPGTGAQAKTVKLLREKYEKKGLDAKLCGAVPEAPRLGYLRLAQFQSGSAAAMKRAVEDLVAGGADALVLDVRSNGGGSFPASLQIAKQFLNKGVIVYIADGDGVRDIFEADNTAIAPKVPIVMLVNKGTASASEVLAGALQDNGRAKLLGEPTFGKGLIQTLVELSDGSAVAVTTAQYRTPSGTDINKIGIFPNGELPVAPPLNGSFCEFLGTEEAKPDVSAIVGALA